MRGGAAPLREQVVRLGSSLLPMSEPTRPTPGVPFVSRRKEPKACQGLCPLEPRGGPTEKCFTFQSRSPCGSRTPSIGLLPPIQTDLPLWVGGQIGLIFRPKPYQGHTPRCQSVARQVVIVFTNCPRLHPFWGEQRLRCWGDDNAPQGEYPEGAPLWEILW